MMPTVLILPFSSAESKKLAKLLHGSALVVNSGAPVGEARIAEIARRVDAVFLVRPGPAEQRSNGLLGARLVTSWIIAVGSRHDLGGVRSIVDDWLPETSVEALAEVTLHRYVALTKARRLAAAAVRDRTLPPPLSKFIVEAATGSSFYPTEQSVLRRIGLSYSTVRRSLVKIGASQTLKPYDLTRAIGLLRCVEAGFSRNELAADPSLPHPRTLIGSATRLGLAHINRVEELDADMVWRALIDEIERSMTYHQGSGAAV